MNPLFLEKGEISVICTGMNISEIFISVQITDIPPAQNYTGMRPLKSISYRIAFYGAESYIQTYDSVP